MQLPRYCIVGRRPVKAIPTDEGGMDILAYDWQTRTFERHMEYLTTLVLGDHELQDVTEDQFTQYVEQLRQEHSEQ